MAYRYTGKKGIKQVEAAARNLGLTVHLHQFIASFPHQESEGRENFWLIHVSTRKRDPLQTMQRFQKLIRSGKPVQFYYGAGRELVVAVSLKHASESELRKYLDYVSATGVRLHEVTTAELPAGKNADAQVIRLSGNSRVLRNAKLHELLGITPQAIIFEETTNLRPPREGN